MKTALLEASISLDIVLNNSLSGIIIYSTLRDEADTITDFRMVAVNDRAKQETPRLADWYPGKNLTLLEFYPNARRYGLLELYTHVCTTGEPYQGEQHFPDVDTWYEIGLSALGPNALMATFRNVSDRKRAEGETLRRQQEIERLNRTLLRANEHLQQFAYVASHDLQEPLRKIQSFSSILRERYVGALDDQGLNLLDRMQRAAERMSDLITALLHYSRLTPHTTPPAQCALNTIVKDVSRALADDVARVNAEIDVAPLPTVPGHCDQLQQLFFCLLDNALRHRRPDAAPHIRLDAVPVETDTSRAENAGLPPGLDPTRRYVCIRVHDNGLGFDNRYAERIFTIFQRLTPRAAVRGTGIGLAMSRKIAELHGGTVTATAEPGRGATFCVFLPAE